MIWIVFLCESVKIMHVRRKAMNLNVFDYEDIQLIPNKCVVTSRAQCDTSVQFGVGPLNCR